MAKKTVQTQDRSGKKVEMPLGKSNYIWMGIGFAMIVVGFMLMAGGGSDDPNVFNYEMFSFRRITLAPIVVLAGFAVEVYAIMKKPGGKAKQDR